MSLSEDEALQAVKKRLETELKPGDKIIVEMLEDGFRVYSEFREVRSERIKAAVGHK